MLTPLKEEELLETLADNFNWSLLLPLVVRKRLNDDVRVVSPEIMEEDRDFNLVAKFEVALSVRGASEPA